MRLLEYMFGLTSVASLVFALYVYFAGKAFANSMVEKLRAARNDLRGIGATATRIREITDSPDWDDGSKVQMVRQLACSLEDSTSSRMNTLDNGTDWVGLSTEEIRKDLARSGRK